MGSALKAFHKLVKSITLKSYKLYISLYNSFSYFFNVPIVMEMHSVTVVQQIQRTAHVNY